MFSLTLGRKPFFTKVVTILYIFIKLLNAFKCKLLFLIQNILGKLEQLSFLFIFYYITGLS